MGRSQFTFYESYYKALTRIKKKADKADAYDAICRYALYGEVPDLDRLPDAAAIAFELIRPTLDASRKKAEGGAKNSKATPKMSDGSAKDIGSNLARCRKDIDKISARYREDTDKISVRCREDTDNEKENEKEKEREYEGESECYSATPAPFSPPSFEEVEEFCKAERINIDPARFFNYYEGRGWMLGSQPMVNWKAVLKSWGDDSKGKAGAKNANLWCAQENQVDPMAKKAIEALMRSCPTETEAYDVD